MNILVLKTDIGSVQSYYEVSPFLNSHPKIIKWSIDQEDCDNVLRIESNLASELEIIDFLSVLGFECSSF